ncbi:acetolactate synthase small subunit [Mangrovibacter phragmitis]|uniref:Acetolactate synthase small subunit n=1 Tax=Mangrovibacter phragmitis TaxID=1691903 RepID=A0A1B7L433_9ENTR|nr:acetolactate synthase small subunit [Mangrovibacter phragmitis]OAT77025.1 acetolactate synthase small subunit [Mangrovibacter phragmitis]
MQQQHCEAVILELTVRNHPGVMSHVCGLFARRAFNVEGILCLPLEKGDQSRIWLQVLDDQRLEQMISQIDKLEDVVQVTRHEADPGVFNKLGLFFQ